MLKYEDLAFLRLRFGHHHPSRRRYFSWLGLLIEGDPADKDISTPASCQNSTFLTPQEGQGALTPP